MDEQEAQVRSELLIGASNRRVKASRDRAKEWDSMGRGLQGSLLGRDRAGLLD